MKQIIIILFSLISIAYGQGGKKGYIKIGATSTDGGFISAKQDSLNWYLPEDYGAVGDGTTNNAAAFTAMIAAMPARGGKVHISKDYAINSTVTINKPVHFFGNGSTMNDLTPNFTSVIRAGVADITLFRVVENHCSFNDLLLTAPYANVSGMAIKIDSNLRATTSPVKRFLLNNVNVYGFYNGLVATNAYLLGIEQCFFQTRNIDITIATTSSPDAGDSYITGCNFENNGAAKVACIYQTNSGGLRITNNKFNFNGSTSYQYGYLGYLTANTADLIITNNSFENHSKSAISLNGSTTNFASIVINSNQIASYQPGSRPDIMIDSVHCLSIVGNVFRKESSNDSAIVLNKVSQSIISNTYGGTAGLLYAVPVTYYGTSINNVGDGAGDVMASFTATQASEIASPQNGKIIYLTSTNVTFTSVGIWARENGTWIKL